MITSSGVSVAPMPLSDRATDEISAFSFGTAPRNARRIVRMQCQPIARFTRKQALRTKMAANHRSEVNPEIKRKGKSVSTHSGPAIWLPSDIINAIADAVIITVHVSDTRQLTLQRLGATPALAEEAQKALRILTHVSRDWRAALLPRAWRTVQLTGSSGLLSAHDIHAFAAQSVRRLVVPWGAMAAPVSWMAAGDGMFFGDANNDAGSSSNGSSSSSDSIVGFSVDSCSRLHRGKDAPNGDSASTNRLRSVFGDQAWPAVEHLDMSFMPLICYQGFAAHIQRTMPRLRSMRIDGFVPATALADILQCAQLLPLAAIEIAGSVWANSDSGRRSSGSSWRSSLSTVAAIETAKIQGSAAVAAVDSAYLCTAIHQLPAVHPSLSILAVTGDALRSHTVFAFAMAQTSTLRALHLIECDYKVIDMLRFGRIEERHMQAVEWATTQMVLPSQEQQAHYSGIRGGRRAATRESSPQPVLWAALKELHIDNYFMAPRENTGLRIYADCMPALEQVVVGNMEPSDSHHPAPAAAGASQVPRLSGVFPELTYIKAPVFDIRSLPDHAPALRSLCVAGAGCVLAQAMAPTWQDIAALLSSSLPLKRTIFSS
ncbi:hypothetical protein BX661DRAFT_199188 [Kickxella alabastrina]|uniref:uncharacterized protein n=1 Tax=Kickxella alabastrina TaxID=61397 RepID=UPI0022209435|nr:uncharacterized protein BX661DRAFT_199188 [Kickxella alabastrina]KAI7825898.1 hypothetical protein BX661DRAFT_199188 [Kickxella alabastrina]KAJ1947250.1 hypothetical protein GGF37_000552 [Kickxella alabastrina]